MNDKSYERLKQALIELGESEYEADALAMLDAKLRKTPSISARDSHKRQVISLMMAELPQEKSKLQQLSEWYPIAVLMSQLQVIRRELWLASLAILLIGMIVTLTSPEPELLSFSVLAPIAAAGSVAMLYDDDVRAMLEIEETTRASARLLLLARMTLVFGFNLVLALIGSVILALFDKQTLLVPLIMSWLAPMTFLAGFAFFLSIIARDTLLAAGASLVLWIGHLIMTHNQYSDFWLILLSMPGLSDPSNRPILLIAGVVLTMVALWMVGTIDKQTGQYT